MRDSLFDDDAAELKAIEAELEGLRANGGAVVAEATARYAEAGYEAWCRRTVAEDLERLRDRGLLVEDRAFYRARVIALRNALVRMENER